MSLCDVCPADRSRAAVALESCVLAAMHHDVFEALAQSHKAEDIALHAFLEQLMAEQYEVCGSSPNLHLQVRRSHGCKVFFSMFASQCISPSEIGSQYLQEAASCLPAQVQLAYANEHGTSGICVQSAHCIS